MQHSITIATSNISDSGKVKIGGSAIDLRKPIVKKQADVADNGKVKIGGGGIDLRKPKTGDSSGPRTENN